MVFMLPALAIQLYFEPAYLLGIRADIVTLALQSIGLIFVFIGLKYSKCPSYNQNAGNAGNAGNGWSVVECSKCGVKFT